MFRAINESKQLNFPSIFERVRIRGGKDNQRVAFPPVFVQLRMLGDGVFDDRNPEARRVIYAIVETGLRFPRPSTSFVRNDTTERSCPASLRRAGRHIKTDESRREIPLLGVALMAADVARSLRVDRIGARQ